MFLIIAFSCRVQLIGKLPYTPLAGDIHALQQSLDAIQIGPITSCGRVNSLVETMTIPRLAAIPIADPGVNNSVYVMYGVALRLCMTTTDQL